MTRRINQLSEGVFHRNDLQKQNYLRSFVEGKHFPLCDLSLGSSDLRPPAIVLDAIIDALARSESSSYCLHAGTKLFRDSVSDWVAKRIGVKIDPDKEVILLIGSQEGSAHLPLALLDHGDHGLILDPSYPSHLGGLILAGANVEKLLIRYESQWRPDFDSLTLSQKEQLNLITFGFPHNPTAQVGEQSWLDEVMFDGVKNQIVIAHDNPYIDLSLEGESPSLLLSHGWRECGIEFFSFSKAWCMGGLRLGFAVGAEPIINALKSVKSVIDFNQSLALQAGAIAAIQNAFYWPQQIKEVYRERRNRTFTDFNEMGWNIPLPSMALYLWMPIPCWAKNRGWNDEKFVQNLLQETGICLTPGSGFGAGGRDWIRLALVRPIEELDLAIARIRTWWKRNAQI